MRFKINLASQPYENARRFFLEWGIALSVLLIFSGLLVFAAAKTWRANHALSRSISDERARLDKLNTEEKADIEILSKSGNSEVRETSQAINALILRKEFSWTRIFTDLEKMMPARLHVVAITPQMNQSGNIDIQMNVAGDSHDKAVELVQNLEKAPDFLHPQILVETNTEKDKPATQGDTIQFQITAEYVPSAAQAISDSEKLQSKDVKPQPEAASGSEPQEKAGSPAEVTQSNTPPEPARNSQPPARNDRPATPKGARKGVR